ncbi:MAG TPA: DUF1549 domain-containing protein [Candidatus Binatia bacterium]|nr:DUF1549 domain-containing protein [Candidatus Binatia bacterium]
MMPIARRLFGVLGLAALLAAAPGVRSARADLSAAYDGSLRIRGETAAVAGVLNEASAGVAGTLAVESPDPTATGVYFVTGKLRRTRLTLSGVSGTGTRFRWRAVVRRGERIDGPAKLRGPGGGRSGRLSLARRSVDPPASPPRTCDSSYFRGQVMGRVLLPICANCHVAGGTAASANFRVTPNDVLATEASVALNVDKPHPDESRILTKPLALVPHGGGQQVSPGSEQDQILRQWVTLVATDRQCEGEADRPMVPLAPADLLVRASMDLRGLRPALGELDAIEADPNAYEALVDGYLHSPEFLERVKDLYDDALLVRREDFTDEARDRTWAVYGEALELIAWIVGNDRPFTEIGTADYTVANQVFEGDTDRMPFPMEPVVGDAWQPTHYTDGRPHAGLLSTSAFYEVWDTNNTNKNRRRANRWSIVFHCYNFLDTPVDVTRDVDNNDDDAVLNAVTTRADCKACHDRLDPLASFLFPIDNMQRLEDVDPADFFSGDPDRWREANRRPPAVYGVPGTDIRDLGRLLTAHPKFAECQTKRAFQLLFLRAPETSAELATAADVAQHWPTEDNYDFRRLVKRWMLSDAYRQRPADDDPEWVRRASPERLERLIANLTGFVWQRDPDDDEDDADAESDPPRTAPVPLLTTEERGFKIILGGINGVSVSGRSHSLNASVAMVQRKVAALAADHVLRTDLALPDGERKLLHGVSGAEDPVADEAALRAHVVALARRLYGQRLAPDAPQVSAWVQLYRNLWADGTQSGTEPGRVPGTAGERAWRGLLVAMLRSPKIVLY